MPDEINKILKNLNNILWKNLDIDGNRPMRKEINKWLGTNGWIFENFIV